MIKKFYFIFFILRTRNLLIGDITCYSSFFKSLRSGVDYDDSLGKKNQNLNLIKILMKMMTVVMTINKWFIIKTKRKTLKLDKVKRKIKLI